MRAKPPKGSREAMKLAQRLKKLHPGYPWGNYLRAAWKSVKGTK